MDDLTDVRWLADYSEEGVAMFRIGRRGDEVVAEWTGTARFFARRDGSAARLEPLEGAVESDVEKIRDGSAVLLLRHLQGKVAIHGAVVGEHGRAIALLGRSGQGKSTLAAALCAVGSSLYSDDAIALDEASEGTWCVRPLERNHWLDPSARRALGDLQALPEARKTPIAARSTGSDPSKLVAIVDLAFDDAGTVSLQRTSGLEALGALIPQAVRFAIDDCERHKRELELLAKIADAVPVFRLGRRRDFALLPSAVDLLRQLIRTHSEAP